MRVKAWLPLVAALVLGVAAAFLVKKQMLANKGPAQDQGNFVSVVVAKQDVGPAQALTLADLTTTKMPANAVPSQSFNDPNQVAGRVTTTQLVKGLPIVEPSLAEQGAGSGPQALVPAGYRAITLQVNEFSGVAGMLAPGNRVDVITVIRDGQQAMARTIVQGLKVLAIGRDLAKHEGNEANPPANSVTLLVTPEQAQAIQLAMSNGQPWLALRSTRDEELVDAKPTKLDDLKGEVAPGTRDVTPPAYAGNPTDPFAAVTGNAHPTSQPAGIEPRPTTPQRTIVLIRGTKEQTVQVDVPTPFERPQFGDTDRKYADE